MGFIWRFGELHVYDLIYIDICIMAYRGKEVRRLGAEIGYITCEYYSAYILYMYISYESLFFELRA